MRLEMTALTRPIRRLLGRAARRCEAAPATRPAEIAEPKRRRPIPAISSVGLDIAESDPLLAYLQSAPGPVDLARLELELAGGRRPPRGRRRR
jgi:hypothetical protein